MARSAAKRLRLSLVGPIEDQPRLLRAYGRVGGAEVALVLAPHRGRGVLVQIRGKAEARAWRSWQAWETPGGVRAKATVLRDGRTALRIEEGPRAGATVRPRTDLPASVAHGTVIDVVAGDDGQTDVHLGGFDGDVPLAPAGAIAPRQAVQLVRDEQKNLPPAGPTTLRGRWSGVLTVADGVPRVELKRKLATYGTLHVHSGPTTGWCWTFERETRWFTGPEATEGHGFHRLSAAIEAGVLGAMALVRPACAFRDTRRRAAHDEVFAERHPIRPRKPMQDPTERLRAPEAPARRAPTARGPRPHPSPPGPDVDKDQVLLDAFRAALADTLREEAP